MYFNKLLKLVKQKKSIKGETCMVCHFPIENDIDNFKLKCNHCYHKSCIKTKLKNISCPYCLQITYSKKCIICKKFIFNKKICEDCDIKNKHNKCQVKLKSGKNKGKRCNRINCKIHKNKLINCQVILKSGKRKGEVCSRENCKYHNKIKKNTKSTKSTKSKIITI